MPSQPQPGNPPESQPPDDGPQPSPASLPGDAPQTTRRSRRAGSAASSAASSTPDLVGDTGPGFTPGLSPDAEQELDGDGTGFEQPEVTEEQIRGFLLAGGDALHALAGVGELDWRFTDKDQERLGAPMSRIVNKHSGLQAIAAHSDEAAVAIGMGLWTWRSLLERQAVLGAREPDADNPPAGAPAPAVPGAPAGPAFRAPGDVAETVVEAASIETPPGYVPAADRLRATRPQGT